jgi:hypothetical protein
VQVSFTIADDTNTELEEKAWQMRLPKSTVADMMIRRGMQATADFEKSTTRRKRVA